MQGITGDPVEHILRAPHLFARLGLPLQPAEATVVKACYTRLARKVHPDKCSHEGATEAFKLLLEAYETLLDPIVQEELLRTLQKKRKIPRDEEIAAQVKPKWYYEHTRRTKEAPTPPPRASEPPPKKKKPTSQNYYWKYEEEDGNNAFPRSNRTETRTVYTCSVCSRSFPTQAILEMHIRFGAFNHKHPKAKPAQKESFKDEDIFPDL